MHHALKKGTKNFHYTSKSSGIFSDFTFLWKCHGWVWRCWDILILAKKGWKKIKSPSSMRNGRFHPPKCKGKLQKMGLLYTHFSKRTGISQTSQKKFKNNNNFSSFPPLFAQVVRTLFPLKVLVPCKKCSWFKIVIMIFWKGWRSPTPLKSKIHCFLVGGTGGYSFYFLLNLQLKCNAL
jgi:hypothetical protein